MNAGIELRQLRRIRIGDADQLHVRQIADGIEDLADVALYVGDAYTDLPG